MTITWFPPDQMLAMNALVSRTTGAADRVLTL
jgi:hypothetical protein